MAKKEFSKSEYQIASGICVALFDGGIDRCIYCIDTCEASKCRKKFKNLIKDL